MPFACDAIAIDIHRMWCPAKESCCPQEQGRTLLRIMVKAVKIDPNGCRPGVATFPIVDRAEVGFVVMLVIPDDDSDRLLASDGRDFLLVGSNCVLVPRFDRPARRL